MSSPYALSLILPGSLVTEPCPQAHGRSVHDIAATEKIMRKLISLQKRQGNVQVPPAVGRQTPVASYETCVQNRKNFLYFTNTTKGQLDAIYELLGGDDVCSKLKYSLDGATPSKAPSYLKISLKSRLFLVLVRMRRDLPLKIQHMCLAYQSPL